MHFFGVIKYYGQVSNCVSLKLVSMPFSVGYLYTATWVESERLFLAIGSLLSDLRNWFQPEYAESL